MRIRLNRRIYITSLIVAGVLGLILSYLIGKTLLETNTHPVIMIVIITIFAMVGMPMILLITALVIGKILD